MLNSLVRLKAIVDVSFLKQMVILIGLMLSAFLGIETISQLRRRKLEASLGSSPARDVNDLVKDVKERCKLKVPC